MITTWPLQTVLEKLRFFGRTTLKVAVAVTESTTLFDCSALSVDSGVSSLSSGSSHYSSLTSLASLTAGGGGGGGPSSSMQPPPPPTSQSQQPRKQSASESSSEATAPKRLAASCVPKVSKKSQNCHDMIQIIDPLTPYLHGQDINENF